MILITVSTKHADVPGLLWVDLIGSSNAPRAVQKVLSHFMLRAVKDGFVVSVTPNRNLEYGHVLNPHWIDVSIGKLWLSDCEMRHGGQCSKPAWAEAMEKPKFLRLLDVDNLNIVVSPDPDVCRYVALSYVWGGAEMLKLRSSLLQAISMPNSLEPFLSALPRTVIDAMEVVKELGERYLWVDALYILQEYTIESQEQIASMDSVYGSAVLTIVAAGGDSADTGLRGVRHKHFAVAEKVPWSRDISQPSAAMGRGLAVITPTNSYQNLEESQWNSRAWTFQERLLSRRLISSADDGVVWHCRCMTAREDMPVSDTGANNPSLEWLNLKPQYLGIGVDSHWTDGNFEVTRH